MRIRLIIEIDLPNPLNKSAAAIRKEFSDEVLADFLNTTPGEQILPGEVVYLATEILSTGAPLFNNRKHP